MLSCAIVEPDLVACETGDISAITAIYRHAVLQGRANFEFDPPDEDEMAVRRERLVLAGYQMVAVIGDSANHASVRLHQRLGFSLVGTLRSVGWKHEHWLDTVLMQWALGAGDAIPR